MIDEHPPREMVDADRFGRDLLSNALPLIQHVRSRSQWSTESRHTCWLIPPGAHRHHSIVRRPGTFTDVSLYRGLGLGGQLRNMEPARQG